MVIVELALGAWALAIAVADVRSRRVPNGLLLAVALPAVVLQLVTGRGLLHAGTADAALGALIGFSLAIAGYLVRQMGAADVKYAAILGFLAGRAGILTILLLSALVIGLLSLAAWLEARRREAAPRKVPAALALSVAFVAYMAGG